MKKNILTIVIILLLAIAGGFIMCGFIRNNSWKKQELEKYATHSGGDMNGSSSGTTLAAYGDDKALLTFSSKDWYYQDPSVKEYLVDREALDEIKEIFMKHKMYKWDGKKFSNIFVADGASTGYGFYFTDDTVNFSSQVYPKTYMNKLKELDAVIEKYKQLGEPQPGLVTPEITEETMMSRRAPDDGKVKVEVYEYSGNRLYYRVMNGTQKEIPMEGICVLTGEADNRIDTNSEKNYSSSVPSESVYENSIKLERRLEAGKYILKVDDMNCTFEIK